MLRLASAVVLCVALAACTAPPASRHGTAPGPTSGAGAAKPAEPAPAADQQAAMPREPVPEIAPNDILGYSSERIAALPQKIVMVSHDLDHFDGFDRLLWLEDGRLRMDGPPDRVREAYRKDIALRLGREPELAAL